MLADPEYTHCSLTDSVFHGKATVMEFVLLDLPTTQVVNGACGVDLQCTGAQDTQLSEAARQSLDRHMTYLRLK
jgi:hypothetical protein